MMGLPMTRVMSSKRCRWNEGHGFGSARSSSRFSCLGASLGHSPDAPRALFRAEAEGGVEDGVRVLEMELPHPGYLHLEEAPVVVEPPGPPRPRCRGRCPRRAGGARWNPRATRASRRAPRRCSSPLPGGGQLVQARHRLQRQRLQPGCPCDAQQALHVLQKTRSPGSRVSGGRGAPGRRWNRRTRLRPAPRRGSPVPTPGGPPRRGGDRRWRSRAPGGS